MDESGEQFLHQRDSRLHTTNPVEHEKARKERKGKKTSQKPAKKIANWLKVIERTHMGHRDDPRVLERIKKYYHKGHVITQEDIPESYYENQRRLIREQGYGDVEITDEMKAQFEVIISDQESTLDNWVDYFSSPDSDSYPMWSKYWAFNGMLKLSTYNKEKHAFGKRDKNTVAPFPDLNREALAYVIDVVVKKINKEHIPDTEDSPELQKLLQGTNFGKLYAYAIEKVTPTEENELINTQGEWIKYPKGSDHMPLVKSIQGHGTGWCTAGETTAKTQLEYGNIYVYYSYDQQGKPIIPRVAIRMQDSDIAEVRGIAHEQNLDPYIDEVVDEKLKEFPDGENYKKKLADMKKLTEIDRKNTAEEELTKDDLRFLYEFDSKIEGFGYQKDPRIEEILAGRDIKSDISSITGYSKEQISITKEEALKGGIKFHYGNLYLHGLQSAEGLDLPETMYGDLDLGNLQSAEGLILPKTMHGDLNLTKLQSAKDLHLPKTMHGDITLYSLQSAEGLDLPETMYGNLDLFNLLSAKGLILPETLNGNLHLESLQSAEDLILPKTLNGTVYLRSIEPDKRQKMRMQYPNIRFFPLKSLSSY